MAHHDVTHGDAAGAKEPLYRRWIDMRNRCSNPNNVSWKRYGGRGIRVCADWDDYTVFKSWALANGFSPELQLDRRDNDGPYSPENCRWVDRTTNIRNSSGPRLTMDQAKEIRALRLTGLSHVKLAKLFNISKGSIAAILAGTTFKE